MGVRNFAEALGGFVPNKQTNEKNAMISRYSGIFNTIRVFSNAIQFITKFLEDLLGREIDGNNEARGETSTTSMFAAMFKPFQGVLHMIRSVAAQVLSAYNYYSPEISYSRCVGTYVQKEYPGVLPEITIPSTMEAINATYRFATNYMNTMFTVSKTSESSTGSNMIYTDVDNNQVYTNDQTSNNYDYQQHLYALYNKNPETTDIQSRIKRARSENSLLFRLGSPKQTFPVNNEDGGATTNSMFNFEKPISEYFRFPQIGGSKNSETAEEPNFGRCTQNYALDVFWRIVESIIMSDEWHNVKP